MRRSRAYDWKLCRHWKCNRVSVRGSALSSSALKSKMQFRLESVQTAISFPARAENFKRDPTCRPAAIHLRQKPIRASYGADWGKSLWPEVPVLAGFLWRHHGGAYCLHSGFNNRWFWLRARLVFLASKCFRSVFLIAARVQLHLSGFLFCC